MQKITFLLNKLKNTEIAQLWFFIVETEQKCCRKIAWRDHFSSLPVHFSNW